MTKIYVKLIAMALALVLSVSVVIMSSYAWMVLSESPAVSGIQVAIGGGNTILVAPNIREEADDGTVYNYPGYFSDKMNFGTQSAYGYLGELAGLSPVSTSNGIDWFISENKIDSFLSYANLTPADEEKASEGSYVYLDFWVVSPSGDYELRVSTGDETADGGSFVIDLLEVTADEDGYTLTEPESKAASAVRIGFLANDVMLTDGTMLKYSQSNYYNDYYTSLKGMYMEPDSGAIYLDSERFIIYEPNGDSHPADDENDGKYIATLPLALEKGVTYYDSYIWNRLSVQLSSEWALSRNESETFVMEEMFQTFLAAKNYEEDKDVSEIMAEFYGGYLQGQIAPYVKKGSFIGNSANLSALEGKSVAENGDLLKGATEDVYIIKLEQNVPQRIRMFVWIEAQDADCKAISGSACFAVNIEFAGGN